MNNELLLNQEREGIQFLIDENLETITIERLALIDNGFGELVDDPTGTPTPYTINCRISHRSSQPLLYERIQAGLSTNMERFILCNHDNVIYEHDIITDYLGKRWRIGKVDVLEAFAGIIGYEAKIFEAEGTQGET